MHSDSTPAPSPHALPAPAVLAQWETSPAGLSAAEAAERLARFGPNAIQSGKKISAWAILAGQFKNVLILILLAATAASAVLGHATEAAAITVIVLLAVVLGFIQEYRAEKAIEALRQMAAPLALVRRDGLETRIPARELVPGDIVRLQAGDRIGADARLLEAADLRVQEAVLTGESLAVEKDAAALAGETAAVGDRRNMVFAGTLAVHGRGLAVVCGTGMDSEFGRIAGLLGGVETGRTPLQKNLDKLGKSLARAALIIVAVIVIAGLVRGQPWVEMLVFGIALAVAVVPEALPAVVTVSLALGVRNLARRNALMRRLPAVETLGSTSVICTDKTGTLTKDEMTVRRLFVAGASIEVTGAGYEPVGDFRVAGAPAALPPEGLRLLSAALLCSDAVLAPDAAGGAGIQGDPTEGALVVAAAKAGLSRGALEQEHKRVGEIPFSSDTRRMVTLHERGTGAPPVGDSDHGRGAHAAVAYAKGAPEAILPLCALDEAQTAELAAEAEKMAASGLRLLAVAEKSAASLEEAQAGGWTLLGLVGMMDPPRPEAKEAIRVCGQAGIRVVMITGDHPATAAAIARELGIPHADQAATGAELDAMDDAAFDRAAADLGVYARVSPALKLRIVSSLQRQGFVVAMTGDGVNDAPALKQADIGVAMGKGGTDVAREAAAMTLTDDNFASIVAAVEEGRAVFGNIRKYLAYLLSSNIGELGLMASAALMGLEMPLGAVQLLYVNLATDGLPALALAADPHDRDLMAQKPRDPRRGVFSHRLVFLMFLGGLWSAGANLGLYLWASRAGHTHEAAATQVFVSLVLIQFFKAYAFRSERLSTFVRPFANRWLNLAIFWELLMLAAVLYWPLLQKPFKTHAMTGEEWLWALVAALSIVPAMEIGKWVARRWE